MNLLKDYCASRVLCQGKLVLNYGQVYFKTNEDLVDPIIDIDFKDKDVISVMSSSDQLFTSNFLEAKSTDTFDRNILTYYYYFLRKWTIDYVNELYPEELLNNDYKWLYELLKEVNPKSKYELLALKYWANHLMNKTDFTKMFFDDPNEGRTLYTSAEELKEIAAIKVNFSLVNFFHRIESKKKYDISLFSNTIEWARGNEKYLKNIRDNFINLLKDDGIVICSSFQRRTIEEIENERKIFLTDFDFEEIDSKHYMYKKKIR